MGFNGGDHSQSYLEGLESLVNITSPWETDNKDWRTAKGKDFQNLESYGDEQSLEEFDNFLANFGI